MTFLIKVVFYVVLQFAKLGLSGKEINQSSFIYGNHTSFGSLRIVIKTIERTEKFCKNIIVSLLRLILRAVIIRLETYLVKVKFRTIVRFVGNLIRTLLLNAVDESGLTVTSITCDDDQLIFQVFDVLDKFLVKFCLTISQVI